MRWFWREKFCSGPTTWGGSPGARRRRELAAQSCPMTSTFSAKQVRGGCGYTYSTHTNGNKKYWKKQTNQKPWLKKEQRAESLRPLKTAGFYLERWPSSRYPNTRVSFLILVLYVSVFCGSQRTYGGSLSLFHRARVAITLAVGALSLRAISKAPHAFLCVKSALSWLQ